MTRTIWDGMTVDCFMDLGAEWFALLSEEELIALPKELYRFLSYEQQKLLIASKSEALHTTEKLAPTDLPHWVVDLTEEQEEQKTLVIWHIDGANQRSRHKGNNFFSNFFEALKKIQFFLYSF